MNLKKVFWVAFAVVYLCLILSGAAYNSPGSFPRAKWIGGYLLLIAAWSALGGLAAVIIARVVENANNIARRAVNGTRSIGQWFTS